MSGRVRYADVVPYETPSNLAELRGPASGFLRLPLTVYWGPHESFDLDDPGELHCAYRALVRAGTAEVQAALLNREVLVREWESLTLPERCRRLWEDRHPELAATTW